MSQSPETSQQFKFYSVWDRTVRIFHWINVLCIIGLIAVGLIIYFGKSFGVSSEGKVLLKTIHVYIGYVFVLNLGWRIIWGFVGNKNARWKAILPFGPGYKKALSDYTDGLKKHQPPAYLGHNPLARLMVSWLFILLITQAITGLVLAGTDLYLPPFGAQIKTWVTAKPADNSLIVTVKAGSKDGTDPQAYTEMRAFRKPFITVHEIVFYLLSLSIVLHILAVVIMEIKEKNTLVSAMFTGKKAFSSPPVDDKDKT